jgi:deazaflavin-dependent oxidoreductase (nitroreductase family)
MDNQYVNIEKKGTRVDSLIPVNENALMYRLRPMASFIEKKSPDPYRRKRRMLPDLHILADADFCYLTTTGRVSGRPHTIEIWFALYEHTLYMLSGAGDRSDWVKNALSSPEVQVKINEIVCSGLARVVNGVEEDALARKLVSNKYTPRSFSSGLRRFGCLKNASIDCITDSKAQKPAVEESG